MSTADFDALIKEGANQSLVGWDFSWLNPRTREEPLPWDYRAVVLARLPEVDSLLDLGTGGGEFLASLAPLPPLTCATEGYPPNVPLARARLEPLGVQVADVSQVEDNRLPFADAAFQLVIDRHEGVRAEELYRVLQPGGRYITQQVGGKNCLELNLFLEEGAPTYQYQDCTLENYTTLLKQAGLRVVEAREAFPRWTFLDIAGVVFYLKAIPWQIPDFATEKYRDKLLAIYQTIQREGGFTIHEHRLFIQAARD